MAAGLEKRLPRAAETLLDAEEDILAFMAFPPEHWRQIYSTNPLERLNKEVKHRTDVVWIHPNRGSVGRLAGVEMTKQDDEWAMGSPYFSQESMATPIDRVGPPKAAWGFSGYTQ